MAKTIDYYMTALSPYAYLGSALFADIVKRHGATVNVYPVQYGKIFPVSGGLPLAKRAKQRQDYRLVELTRWRDFRGVPLNLHPKHFPTDENLAARMIIVARRQGLDALALANAIGTMVWAEDRDIADPKVLERAAASVGFEGPALLDSARDEAIQKIYDEDTDRAIEIGVFGAPTYIIDGEMFWGQDRLDFVERKLKT